MRKPQVIIAVVVLLIVAACLAAVAVYANQIGSDGSESTADIAALASASPSATEAEETDSGWTVAAGGESKSSAAKKAKGDSRSSNTATTASHSGASSAAGGGSGNSGASSSGSSATRSKSGGKSGGSSSSPTRPSKPAALTCTLSIDAKTAGLGTFMPTRKVTFKKGETVFDVLKRECRAAGIPIEFEWTPMYKSAYIEGINGLYEFDRGELSGWMYSVNGWFPNYGCSRYKLKAGDRIQWRYTCDLGKDIGGDYATGQSES